MHASAGVQLRAGSDDLQLNLQLLSQPSPSVALPSSHSSGAVTIPSPHFDATHWPARQSIPLPHASPSESGVPAWHVWSAEQVSLPLHALPSSQSLSTEQAQRHSAVHG